MAGMMQRGSAFITRRHKQASGVPIKYRRGKLDAELVAIPGASPNAGDELEGVPVLDYEQEWVIERSDLVIDSNPILPQEKDYIDWPQENGDIWRYKVLPVSPGEECFELDRFRRRLRVFTKFMGESDG